MRAVIGVEFSNDVLQVPFDRILGDVQPVSDEFVSAAIGYASQDLELPRREILDAEMSSRRPFRAFKSNAKGTLGFVSGGTNDAGNVDYVSALGNFLQNQLGPSGSAT